MSIWRSLVLGLAVTAWSSVAPAAVLDSLAPTPGDFNRDGRVDAADYTVWRDGLGSLYDLGDYNDWKSSFGQLPAAGAGSTVASVPEPTAAVLGFAPVFLALAPRRRQTL